MTEVEFAIGTGLTVFFRTEEDGWFVHGIRKDGKCRQAHRVRVEEDDYPPEVLGNIAESLGWMNHILSTHKCYNPNDLTNRMPELEAYDA